ncbi:MAG: hypothetical protein ACRD2E_12480 [Terriglobales bacterium]
MVWRLAALAAAGFTLAAFAAPPPSPRITFTESFPGSQPVFFQIVLNANGAAIYRTVEQAGQPSLQLHFTAAPRLTARIFALARQLHDFRTPRLESHSRVGDMGAKTLAYDDAAHQAQQSFNFTTVPAAAELNRFFQGVSTASEDALRLRREIRYEPLGVIQALNQIGRDWEQHLITAVGPLLPELRRAASDPDLMHLARRRARRLIRSLTKDPSA